MKICEIWEKIKNEPVEVKDMVIETLDPQLNVRFKQIIEEKIKNLGTVYEEIPRDHRGRLNLAIFSDEAWQELGYNKCLELDLFRIFHLYVRHIGLEIFEYHQWRVMPDELLIVPDLSDDVPYEDLKLLFLNISYIIHRVYESEFIDIDDETLSNLKKLP